MNIGRIQPAQHASQRKLFAERKNLTAARLEGHRRGEQAGVRKGIVMGVLAGAFSVVVVLVLMGKVAV